MRPLLTSALVAAIGITVLPAMPQVAQAGTGVLRCQMPDGTNVYTNAGCGAFAATAKPLPGELLNRIERDRRHQARLVAQETGMPIELIGDETAAAAMPTTVRRPLAGGCATTPAQLAMDLRASVALGDVNRIAESFDWAGMDNTQAQRIMARLAQIAERPVRDVEFFDASIGVNAMFAAAGEAGDVRPGRGMGTLQVAFDAGNGDSVIDFDVRRDEGCYLLRF